MTLTAMTICRLRLALRAAPDPERVRLVDGGLHPQDIVLVVDLDAVAPDPVADAQPLRKLESPAGYLGVQLKVERPLDEIQVGGSRGAELAVTEAASAKEKNGGRKCCQT